MPGAHRPAADFPFPPLPPGVPPPPKLPVRVAPPANAPKRVPPPAKHDAPPPPAKVPQHIPPPPKHVAPPRHRQTQRLLQEAPRPLEKARPQRKAKAAVQEPGSSSTGINRGLERSNRLHSAMVAASQVAAAADQASLAAKAEASRAASEFWDGEEARYSRYQALAEQMAAREQESFATHMERAVATWRDTFAAEEEAVWKAHDAEEAT